MAVDSQPPRIPTLDRRLAWSRLARALFDEPGPPVELGGFRVLGILGRGAMGTVYLAHDQTLEREVALKLVELVDPSDPSEVLREARALARVAHANVVTVHEVGEAEGAVYIVMERVEGQTLDAWQRHPRPWSEILALYLDLARGLAAAHERAVVHRDFKPANVRVDEHGRARILDFGLASAPGLESAGGTPAYMAPEQAAGAPADPRMDQYAWAVALHEALYGVRPDEDAPEPATQADPRAAQIQAVLERALAPDPAQRWPSMRALITELERPTTTHAEQRGRALLLDRVERMWLTRPHSPSLQPRLARVGLGSVELSELEQTLARAGSILILGGPGSGKTTTSTALAARLHARACREPSSPAPVVLSLSSWSAWPSDSLHEWLLDALRVEYGIPAKISRVWLDEDELVILLDGLDEVTPPRRRACADAIATLRDEHLIGVALSCRSRVHAELGDPHDYDRIIELEPLTIEAVEAALSEAGRDELATRLRAEPRLAELVTTPLAVELLLDGDLGEGARIDPAATLDDLQARHIERRLAQLDPAERPRVRAGLTQLARLLDEAGASELWLERMQPSWLGRPAWARVHAGASALAMALTVALVVALTLTPAAGLSVGLGSAALVGLVFAAFVGVSLGLGRIQPIERLSWSWSQLRQSWRGALIRALLVAVLISAVATSIWGWGRPPAFVVAVAVSNFVGYALLLSLTLTVLAGLGGELSERPTALNEGTRASACNMLLVWSVVSGVLALPLLGASLGAEALPVPEVDGRGTAVWASSPRRFFALVGVCIAVTLGLVAGLLRGGFALIQHACLRVMLALLGRAPLRLRALLERGDACALLRRVGGGYAFVHPTLQAHLGRRDPAVSAPTPARNT